MISKSEIKYSEEIESTHREQSQLLLKNLTWSNLCLIRVFKNKKWYIINEINNSRWDKVFSEFWKLFGEQKSKVNVKAFGWNDKISNSQTLITYINLI